MIVILHQILGMMRFVAELPKALDQLAAQERAKVEMERNELLERIEGFKKRIEDSDSSAVS